MSDNKIPAPIDYDGCQAAAVAYANAIGIDQLLPAHWVKVSPDGSVLIDDGRANNHYPPGFEGLALRRFDSMVDYRRALETEVSGDCINRRRGILRQIQYERLLEDEERRASEWEGDAWKEGRSKKEIAAIMRGIIKQAMKNGELPMPDDYLVSVRQKHDRFLIVVWSEHDVISHCRKLSDRLRLFNKSTFVNGHGCLTYRIEQAF